MKKLSKLKLNEISKRNLSQKEMRHVKGGGEHSCGCACYYAGPSGGSSVEDNCRANMVLGYDSPGGGIPALTCIRDVTVPGYNNNY